MRSDAILDRLLSLHPVVIDLSLERLQRLLDAMGNPERKLPPIIHIAGTNGKGSTQALLRACLEAAGYKVHAYTSPHLVRFHERIRLAGNLIEEDALADLLSRVEAINDGDNITFFEVTTAAAILAFSETPADIVLLEVGLGGRFDATNVIDKPAVSVITPVSHDHAQFLGTDLAGIAGEKAGILKTGCPAVIGKQQGPALTRIKEIAQGLGIDPVVYGEAFTPIHQENGFILDGTEWPRPALSGDHQIDNAATALITLQQLSQHLPGFDIRPDHIRQGLQNAFWPARLQAIDPKDLGLSPDLDIWLDGGHNPDAAEKLAAHLAGFNDQRPVHLITGMLNSKDASGFFDAFPKDITLHALTIPDEDNALTSAEIADRAKAAGLLTQTHDDFAQACAAIPANARLLICGSLYFAGYVLAEMEKRAETEKRATGS